MNNLTRHGRLLSYCLAAAVGCGGDEKPNLLPVHGTVMLNGQPLATGQVVTMLETGRGAAGQIQPDGTFELTTYEKGDGALPGTHKAAVTAYENSDMTDPEADLGKSLVPERYGNPETSGLTIDVTADGENAPVLELTSP